MFFALANIASCAGSPRARYLNRGQEDGALATFEKSTNGLTMYWPEQGPWQSKLLTVSLDRVVYLLTLDPSGQALTEKHALVSYLGGMPLDVWAQNPDSVFPHSIWIADHGEDAIYVLDPASTAPADRVAQFFHSKIIVTRRYLADAMARAQAAYSRWRRQKQPSK